MTTMEEDDEALIGRYARGDAAAFDQLYRRHELRVWRYLERNVCNQATSDDLLQDVWFALARNAASLESVTRFRTRLFTLAHDRMTDSLRARAAKPNPPAAAGRPAAAHDPPSALAQAIGQLPGEQREAYLLQIEGDLSLGDIAEITESTVDTVESRLRLARLKLHESTKRHEPPNQDQLSEVDHLYRRLTALDTGRPGEWVRRKVQAYAAQQAAERAVRASARAKDSSTFEAPTPIATAIPTAAKQTANKPWLLPVTFGAIAAAALVGFLVVSRLMTPRDTPKAALSPAPVSQPEPTTPEMAQTSAPPSQPEPTTPKVAQASTPPSPEPVSPAPPSPPVQSSAPPLPASPPPVPQSPATTSLARTPVAPPSTAPPAPVVASSSAGTPPAQSLTQARVARQKAAAPLSARISSDRAETTTHAARPAPPAESAPAPQIEPVPSTDTQVASVPPPPVATPSPTQPAPTPAAAASNPPDELWLAAKSGDMSGLQAALAGNVDVNALDANGQTALILAIQHNHVDIVRALLAHGANPNTADSRGFTPVRAARVRGNLAILTALERNGRH
jgi:RNA polymerase sigma factor (sigma-70 family)